MEEDPLIQEAMNRQAKYQRHLRVRPPSPSVVRNDLPASAYRPQQFNLSDVALKKGKMKKMKMKKMKKGRGGSASSDEDEEDGGEEGVQEREKNPVEDDEVIFITSSSDEEPEVVEVQPSSSSVGNNGGGVGGRRNTEEMETTTTGQGQQVPQAGSSKDQDITNNDTDAAPSSVSDTIHEATTVNQEAPADIPRQGSSASPSLETQHDETGHRDSSSSEYAKTRRILLSEDEKVVFETPDGREFCVSMGTKKPSVEEESSPDTVTRPSSENVSSNTVQRDANENLVNSEAVPRAAPATTDDHCQTSTSASTSHTTEERTRERSRDRRDRHKSSSRHRNHHRHRKSRSESDEYRPPSNPLFKTEEELIGLLKRCRHRSCKGLTFPSREKCIHHHKERHKEKHCPVCFITIPIKGTVLKTHWMQHHQLSDDREKAECPFCYLPFSFEGIYQHIGKMHLVPQEQNNGQERRSKSSGQKRHHKNAARDNGSHSSKKQPRSEDGRFRKQNIPERNEDIVTSGNTSTSNKNSGPQGSGQPKPSSTTGSNRTKSPPRRNHKDKDSNGGTGRIQRSRSRSPIQRNRSASQQLEGTEGSANTAMSNATSNRPSTSNTSGQQHDQRKKQGQTNPVRQNDADADRNRQTSQHSFSSSRTSLPTNNGSKNRLAEASTSSSSRAPRQTATGCFQTNRFPGQNSRNQGKDPIDANPASHNSNSPLSSGSGAQQEARNSQTPQDPPRADDPEGNVPDKLSYVQKARLQVLYSQKPIPLDCHIQQFAKDVNATPELVRKWIQQKNYTYRSRSPQKRKQR